MYCRNHPADGLTRTAIWSSLRSGNCGGKPSHTSTFSSPSVIGSHVSIGSPPCVWCPFSSSSRSITLHGHWFCWPCFLRHDRHEHHGTIWFHRYCTHRSYTFSHDIWRFLTQNLVLRTFAEEVYVVSHHVHHLKSDKQGDPYNASGGIMYCMLSDVNHQSIAQDMNEGDYRKASQFLHHTGVWTNSYARYLKWGSIASPLYVIGLMLLNWALYSVFFFLGHGLACALFTVQCSGMCS